MKGDTLRILAVLLFAAITISPGTPAFAAPEGAGSTAETAGSGSTAGFPEALKTFLDRAYLGKNLAKELMDGAPEIKAWLSAKVPLRRLHAPGAFPMLSDRAPSTGGGAYGYGDHDLRWQPFPKLANPLVAKGPAPLKDCSGNWGGENGNGENGDGSSEKPPKDGFYYHMRKAGELSWNHVDLGNQAENSSSNEQITESVYRLPDLFRDKPVGVVEVVRNGMLVSTLFFMSLDGGWKLVFIDDAPPCSA